MTQKSGFNQKLATQALKASIKHFSKHFCNN